VPVAAAGGVGMAVNVLVPVAARVPGPVRERPPQLLDHAIHAPSPWPVLADAHRVECEGSAASAGRPPSGSWKTTT